MLGTENPADILTKYVDHATLTAAVETLNMKVMSDRPSAAPAAMGIHSQTSSTQGLPFCVDDYVYLFDDIAVMEEYMYGGWSSHELGPDCCTILCAKTLTALPQIDHWCEPCTQEEW